MQRGCCSDSPQGTLFMPEVNDSLFKTENLLSRHAYLSGLAGMVVIVVMGFFTAVHNAINNGWFLFGERITGTAHQSVLLVLAVCALAMFTVEIVLRIRKDDAFFTVSPKLKSRRAGIFFIECAINYLLYVAILWAAIFFYRFANEYGFRNNNPYYQPFFELLRIVWSVYVWCGFPYTILTRALQHDPAADRREPAYLLLKGALKVISPLQPASLLGRYDLFGISGDPDIDSFGPGDRKILLGLFVKMFFVPLMTVFFTDQFTHLAANWGYIANLIAGADDKVRFTLADFYNVSFTFIFSIDVGLAWCGYAVSTRWIKNTCLSAEPTMLGWLVAVLCYPPFQHMLGIYFTIPAEKGFLAMPYPWLVALFAIMSLMSYVVYMSATVVFGMRFSNLTHRGVIQTGAYAFIRHPAYAAKNFSWWCVMMPLVIYQAASRNTAAVLVQILGLAGMTGLYYLRAITEERHLSFDPAYREYCKKVPHRFIPGLF